ncbi:MAG: outer membrane beta-barrel protein [Aestuariivirga sp.]
MKLKYVVGILLGSTAISGTAFADGWNGMYLGVQGGYASLPSTTDYFGSIYKDATLSGGLLGIDVGIDHQMSNNFVVGVLADWSISNASGDGSIYNPGRDFTLTLHSLGKAQLRAGMSFGAANENLLYLAGGLAFGNVERTGNVTNATNSHVGYVVSAGFEHKFSPSVSIKTEASYVDLGKKTYSGGETVRLGGLLATVGINFHF